MARIPAAAPGEDQITDRERRYIDEYLIDLNQSQAAIRATGVKPSGANETASRFMREKRVTDAIALAMAERSTRAAITADMVLERWWKIATADPRELTQFRRTACRYCHGEGHDFQWIDEIEFRAAVADATERKKPVPARAGGLGYVAIADAHPECPRCNGEGVGRTHGKDTRSLSAAAALLYDGVEETRDGFKIKTLDRMKAFENVARHLGMFVDKVEHTSPDGSMSPQPPVYNITET